MLAPSANPDYAGNLRRLLAQTGLTQAELAARAEIDLRTIVSILQGNVTPRPRTLHQLAAGLDVPVEELFQNPATLAHRLFDRWTNPVVEELTHSRPDLFECWSAHDFDQLYSQFGEGGELTEDGALALVTRMNEQRELHRKVAIVLESHERELLKELVETLFRRVVISDGQPGSAANGNGGIQSVGQNASC